MPKSDTSLTPDIRIQKDNMMLSVTNIRPTFHKKSEQETRQKIEVRLYQIFEKYV